MLISSFTEGMGYKNWHHMFGGARSAFFQWLFPFESLMRAGMHANISCTDSIQQVSEIAVSPPASSNCPPRPTHTRIHTFCLRVCVFLCVLVCTWCVLLWVHVVCVSACACVRVSCGMWVHPSRVETKGGT